MDKKRRIGVFTSARSDYGLLRYFLKEAKGEFDVELLATGAHFCASKGNSIREILQDGILKENKVIRILSFLDSETSQGFGKSVGLAQISFSQIFEDRSYDAIVILGDRFELFGISVPALVHGIPLVHISGGEVTEGVTDDSIRHAHTKLSHIHCVATEEFAENISKMGEEDWRIVITGECGLDELYHFPPASAEAIKADFGIDLNRKIFLITFHPTNLDFDFPLEKQIEPLLDALTGYHDVQKVFTAPGFEKGGAEFVEKIHRFLVKDRNGVFEKNLGRTNYLTIMKHCKAVIGNSSSGIVEAPTFGIPTIDIGGRQANRLASRTVFHVDNSAEKIKTALEKALKKETEPNFKELHNPYDPYRDGKNSQRIVYAIKKALEIPREKLLKKKFLNDLNPVNWNTLIKGFG